MRPIWKYRPFTYSLGASVILILIFFGVITVDLFKNNDIEICSSSLCLKKFLLIYDFPILIGKVSFAILGFIALIYKSEQTQEQIHIAQNQNKYNNFFQHRAMVYKEITESINEGGLIRLDNFNKLYTLVFPKNRPDNFDFKGDFDGLNNSFKTFYVKVFKSSPLRIFETKDLVYEELSIVDKANLSEFIERHFESMFNSMGFSIDVNSDYIDMDILNRKYPNLESVEVERASAIKVSGLSYIKLLKDFSSIVDAINRVAFPNEVSSRLSFYEVGEVTLKENYNITQNIRYIWRQIAIQKNLIIRNLVVTSTR
ncbi:hypothetical protein [Shewanella baltica]|uniref:hypothetical protein n=1 Tax=Shewanella baltica TaxID=62322 RepID=UPI0039AFEBB9